MPQTGFLVHQLVCMLFYQTDRLKRALLQKELTNAETVKK